MRLALPVIALAFATGAAAEPPAPSRIVVPMQRITPPTSQATLPEGQVPCRDTIHEVREARGLPQVDRGTASPDEPLLIAAVDHRINGCSVMVMRDNTSDVRPLPAMPESSGRLQRIPGG